MDILPHCMDRQPNGWRPRRRWWWWRWWRLLEPVVLYTCRLDHTSDIRWRHRDVTLTSQWRHWSPATDEKQCQIECTHRVRTHAVLLLSASPPGECEWNAIAVRNEALLCSVIDHVTLTFDLWTPKQYHFWGIPRSFPVPSLNTLGSFVFELWWGQQTNRQTNGRTRKSYPRRPTWSACLKNIWSKTRFATETRLFHHQQMLQNTVVWHTRLPLATVNYMYPSLALQRR